MCIRDRPDFEAQGDALHFVFGKFPAGGIVGGVQLDPHRLGEPRAQLFRLVQDTRLVLGDGEDDHLHRCYRGEMCIRGSSRPWPLSSSSRLWSSSWKSCSNGTCPRCTRPVSYTHLDHVSGYSRLSGGGYRSRQRCPRQRGLRLHLWQEQKPRHQKRPGHDGGGAGLHPVSYTHLTSNNREATEAIWETLTSLAQNCVGFVIYLFLLVSADIWLMLVILLTSLIGYFINKKLTGYGLSLIHI